MPRKTKARLIGSFALLALFVSGCTTEQIPNFGMPDPATEEGKKILVLWEGSWIAAWIVGALVWGLIIWAVIFHRRRHQNEVPAQTKYNVPIEVLYTVVPFIIIAVLFYFTARDQAAITKLSSDTSNVNVINVNGIRWSWQFTYEEVNATVTGTPAQPPVVYVPLGEKVRFVLTTSDVNHSFWVPAFLMKMDNISGRTNSFEVTPSKLGTFAGKCAELCGRGHYRMLFSVKVVTPSEYDQYLSQLKGATA